MQSDVRLLTKPRSTRLRSLTILRKARALHQLHVRVAVGLTLTILFYVLFIVDKFVLSWTDSDVYKKMDLLLEVTTMMPCGSNRSSSSGRGSVIDDESLMATFTPRYTAFAAVRLCLWLALIVSGVCVLRGNIDWSLLKAIAQRFDTILILAQLSLYAVVDVACRALLTRRVRGDLITWIDGLLHTVTFILAYVFFIATDALLVTSRATRRSIALLLAIITMVNWIMRSVVVAPDEQLDLLAPLRSLASLPTSVRYTAQEAMKSLDFGLLTLTLANVYFTYRRPELVTFMPLRFERLQLAVELERRREEQTRRVAARRAPPRAPPRRESLPGAAAATGVGTAQHVECTSVAARPCASGSASVNAAIVRNGPVPVLCSSGAI